MSESHSVTIEMTAALIPMPAPAREGGRERLRFWLCEMMMMLVSLCSRHEREKDRLTDDADDEPRLRCDEQLSDVRYQP